MYETVMFLTSWLPEWIQITVWTVLKILAILLPLMGAVAYFTFAERKLIGYMQSLGTPNKVPPQRMSILDSWIYRKSHF